MGNRFRSRRAAPSRWAALRRRTGVLVLAAAVLAPATVLLLRWIDPPTTALRLADGHFRAAPRVQAEHVAPAVVLALLAQEDQQYFTRRDPVGWSALLERARKPEAAGGSTLQVQLVKNLFLYRHRDPVRKLLLEPPLAHLLDALVPRDRQIELYLNVAQFGPDLYGICAASWTYHDRPPSELTPAQAASLINLLPTPDGATRAPEGGVLVNGVPQRRPLRLELRMRALAAGPPLPPGPAGGDAGADSCDRRPPT